MTKFEALAKEMNVEITVDEKGVYNGMCKALASITTEIILSNNEEIFSADWEVQKEMIKEKFYNVFPYMA